ncbi:MAG: EAL domain-containing response regulator [Burkholderiales bacterium]|nr:EAL domain-containing response regulator [Burkholderiales bacterium]
MNDQTADSTFRLLVVEDSAVQRNHLVGLLHRLRSCEVLEAENGQNALTTLAASRVPLDLVICDLAMPEMDGMAFIRHLASVQPSPQLVIASSQPRSVLESVEHMARAYGVSMLGILEKPVSLESLSALLDRHCAARASMHRADGANQLTVDEVREGLSRVEFFPVFQPKVEVATGNLHGVEALARWRHPARGVLPPGVFLPIIEEHGLVDQLTWIMLDQSAVMCREWLAGGLQLTVSVNLSLTSLTEADLAQRMNERVRRHGIHPRQIVLEVTERAAMTDVAHMLETLVRLFMSGFRLSIDDYGTGYSSLQQVSRVPFSELKLDQSFVAGASKRESLRVILESSIQLARRLNLSVTAEGVETQDDWDLLRQLDCDHAQGYFIAKPMESAALLDWVSERR